MVRTVCTTYLTLLHTTFHCTHFFNCTNTTQAWCSAPYKRCLREKLAFAEKMSQKKQIPTQRDTNPESNSTTSEEDWLPENLMDIDTKFEQEKSAPNVDPAKKSKGKKRKKIFTPEEVRRNAKIRKQESRERQKYAKSVQQVDICNELHAINQNLQNLQNTANLQICKIARLEEKLDTILEKLQK